MNKVRYHFEKEQDLAWHSIFLYANYEDAKTEFRNRVIEYRSRHYPPTAARLTKEVWTDSTKRWVPIEVVEYHRFS